MFDATSDYFLSYAKQVSKLTNDLKKKYNNNYILPFF